MEGKRVEGKKTKERASDVGLKIPYADRIHSLTKKLEKKDDLKIGSRRKRGVTSTL